MRLSAEDYSAFFRARTRAAGVWAAETFLATLIRALTRSTNRFRALRISFCRIRIRHSPSSWRGRVRAQQHPPDANIPVTSPESQRIAVSALRERALGRRARASPGHYILLA